MKSRVLVALTGLAFFSACGSTATQGTPVTGDGGVDANVDIDAGDAAPDVDNGAPSDVYPAPHPDAPRVISKPNGVVLAHPKLVPVFFPGDTMETQLKDFVATLGATDFFKANVTEYGGGPAVAGTPIVLTETPPTQLDDTAIRTWLIDKIGSGAFAPPEAETIYVLFYPAETTIADGNGKSCQDFGGYHNSVTATYAPVPEGGAPDGGDGGVAEGGSDAGTLHQEVAYAVIPRCATFGGLSGIDTITGSASHEIIEATTDPYPETAGAYQSVDAAHAVWGLLGSETSDLCAQFSSSFYKPAGYPYVVQRSWSNALAQASHNPCAPQLPGEVYFNTAAVLTEDVRLSDPQGRSSVMTKGVKIAVGASKTIELDLFSDAKTSGPWTVSAIDAGHALGVATSLKFSFDRTQGVNGEKLHLTITATEQSPLGASPFILSSKLGTTENLWVGLVVN